MSIQPPRIEARVSAQERMQTILHARLEELSEDMIASFKQQAAYQVQFEQKVDGRFDKIEAEISAVKADMAAMEGRILDAFQQMITIIDTRLPPNEK